MKINIVNDAGEILYSIDQELIDRCRQVKDDINKSESHEIPEFIYGLFFGIVIMILVFALS